MQSLIIVAEAPWARAPLRAAGFLEIAVPPRGRPLTERIIAACDFAETDRATCFASVGCFASGQATRPALEAAAQRAWSIGAVVALDGVTAQAATVAARVRAPTLLLVSRPTAATELPAAQRALAALGEYGELALVDGREEAVTLGRAWFARHVGAAQRDPFVPRASAPDFAID